MASAASPQDTQPNQTDFQELENRDQKETETPTQPTDLQELENPDQKETETDLKELENPDQKETETPVTVNGELGKPAVLDQLLGMMLHMGYDHHESEKAILSMACPPDEIDVNDIIQPINDTRASAPEMPPAEPASQGEKGHHSWQNDDQYWGWTNTDQNWQPNSWDTYGWSNNWKSWYHGWEHDQGTYQRSWSTGTCNTASSDQIQDAMLRSDTWEQPESSEERPPLQKDRMCHGILTLCVTGVDMHQMQYTR